MALCSTWECTFTAESHVLFYFYLLPHHHQVSDDVQTYLNFVCSDQRSVGTDPSHLVLALSLLSLQVFRRLYECAFINQPSSSTMNITHYIVGFAHYFCTATGFICEGPAFVADSPPVGREEMSVWSVTWSAWLATLIFLAAWHQQLVTHKVFAQLKLKNSSSHSIPEGGLFELVSCPHYLCEILIYTALLLILGTEHQTAILGQVTFLT